MRLWDGLRLGLAGLTAHKKQTSIVIIVSGLLFSIIAAAAFLIQGLENLTFSLMLAPTAGKVLIMASVDPRVCDDECNIPTEVAEIKANIQHYGGRAIPAQLQQTSAGIFYELSEDIFTTPVDPEIADDITQILVPVTTAAKLANLSLPGRDAELSEKITALTNAEARTSRQIIADETGQKYYIADILPGSAGATSLSLASVGQGANPLDLLLAQVNTGLSGSFILKTAPQSAEKVTNREPTSGIITKKDVNAEATGLVFAEFPNLETAYNYFRDKSNYCSEFNQFSGNCGRNYKYQTLSAISDPLTTYENFQEIWLIFRIVVAVLTVIASIVAISTFARIIGKDTRLISLYYAVGATRRQVTLVYLGYLLMLSLATAVFAIVMGTIFALALSWAHQTALTQVFTLGFGKLIEGRILLLGWNSSLWIILGVICLASVLTIIACNGRFKRKTL